jgi:tetratricopeptide (TPR) repeat protein
VTEFMETKRLREAEPKIVQAWPSPQDYNESVQNPDSCFSDEALKQAQPELNFLGIPKTASGNFASVYHLFSAKSDCAVRCFLHPYSDQEQRYKAISEKFSQIHAPYLADFKYVNDGIKVAGKPYPILKMEWIQGQTLLQFIQENLDDSRKLKDLAASFKNAVLDLQRNGIAHGDLQHGNIIVDSEGRVNFVDYDNCYVPELAGNISHELGHSCYQHPARSFSDFNERIDNFSAWLILISILALSEDPTLWNKLDAGQDCLLFKQYDLQNPLNSKAFHTLEAHSSETVKCNARFLRSLLQNEFSEVPSLSEEMIVPDDLAALEKLIEPSARAQPDFREWHDGSETSAQESNSLLAPSNPIKKKIFSGVAMRALLWSRPSHGIPTTVLMGAAVLIALMFFAGSFLLNTINTDGTMKAVSSEAAKTKANPWAEYDKTLQTMMNDGMSAFKAGDYAKAKDKFAAALKHTESLGYEDVRQIEPLGALAELYRLQGNYDDAESMLKRLVSVREQYPDERKVELAKALNNLAALYKTEGKYSEAEAVYSKAEELINTSRKDSHENLFPVDLALALAQTENGQADLCRIRNQYAMAEKLSMKALDARRISGENKVDIAESWCTLAKIYSSQGKYKTAEQYFCEASSILAKEYGSESPYLANVLNGLGTAYLAQGQNELADATFNKELKILKSSFGESHPLVAETLNGIAATWAAGGQYSEAEKVLRRALAIREKAYGKTHVFCADSFNKLAENYRKEKKYAKSIEYYKKAMAIYQRDAKANSAGIAALLNNMGLVALEQSDPKQALALFENAKAINEKNLGAEHPIFITNINNIATSLQAEGRYADAEKLYKKALSLREKVLGPKHKAVAESLRNLATLYRATGRDAEADRLDKRALAIGTGDEGPWHVKNLKI